MIRAGEQFRDKTCMQRMSGTISNDTAVNRLAARHADPLKAWKNSPIDAAAGKKWEEYTEARDDMLKRTNHDFAPWHVVLANDKEKARLALMADLLSSFDYKGKKAKQVKPDRDIVFKWSREKHHLLAR
jgi:polyphosphate kinase 2 (PPK2 family)